MTAPSVDLDFGSLTVYSRTTAPTLVAVVADLPSLRPNRRLACLPNCLPDLLLPRVAC